MPGEKFLQCPQHPLNNVAKELDDECCTRLFVGVLILQVALRPRRRMRTGGGGGGLAGGAVGGGLWGKISQQLPLNWWVAVREHKRSLEYGCAVNQVSVPCQNSFCFPS